MQLISFFENFENLFISEYDQNFKNICVGQNLIWKFMSSF